MMKFYNNNCTRQEAVVKAWKTVASIVLDAIDDAFVGQGEHYKLNWFCVDLETEKVFRSTQGELLSWLLCEHQELDGVLNRTEVYASRDGSRFSLVTSARLGVPGVLGRKVRASRKDIDELWYKGVNQVFFYGANTCEMYVCLDGGDEYRLFYEEGVEIPILTGLGYADYDPEIRVLKLTEEFLWNLL